jgi:hypothetical protein
MAKITIYKDTNYGGRNLEFTYPEANLKNEGFNDEASSCKVESGTWILYKDTDFGGDYSVLGPGNYADADAMGISNDSLSSLRPLPESGICLFKDTNFRGRMVALTGAESNFKNINFNDEASSVIVVSGTWNLYEDTNFKGTKWTLDVGQYQTPQEGGFNNDNISSAQPS